MYINFGMIEEFNRYYPDFDFTPYLSELKDLQRLFESRYLSGNSNSIVWFQYTIDEIYFKLRDLVNPKFGEGLIDKIYRKKITGVEQSYQLFEFAYKDNPFLK